MSEKIVRGTVATLVELILEIVVGAGLLLLFVLALAWDPLDRRLGFHAQRREERLSRRSPAPIPLPARAGAYGIAPVPAA